MFWAILGGQHVNRVCAKWFRKTTQLYAPKNIKNIASEHGWLGNYFHFRAKGLFSGETCSKPFLDLNAISRPYACTLRNPYATTIGAYAEDYGQHNLTHCLRDLVS